MSFVSFPNKSSGGTVNPLTVIGPALSTDNAIVRFDGTTGVLIQDYTSGAPTIGDTGAITATAGGSLTGTWSDLGTVTTIDINGGTIDGTTIGGSTRAVASFVRTGVGAAADAVNLATWTQAVATSGSPSVLVATGGAHTTLTASTEAIDAYFKMARTVEFATGALATQRSVVMEGVTYAFVGASTLTTAVTLDLGIPVAGTNATINNPFSLRTAGNIQVTNTNGRLFFSGTGPAIISSTSGVGMTIKGSIAAGTATSQDVLLDSVFTRTAGRIAVIANNGTDRILFTYFGGITLSQGAGATGTLKSFLSTRANHTNQTLSTEISDFELTAYTRQWATGAITTQREVSFGIPTYAFVGASTITTAANVYIAGAPAAGTNATITDSYALWVDAGSSRFDGRVLETQGADVASATNLTLGTDGNSFELTGTTKVDLISNVGWTEGSVVRLIANESVVIDHGTATASTNVQIRLAGAVDYSMTAGDTLTLILSSTTAEGQAWRELARAVI